MSKRISTPIIKPQPKVHFEQINFKIDAQTLEKLRAYTEFIDSEQAYIIREALNYLFENDSTFRDFLASRPRPESDANATS